MTNFIPIFPLEIVVFPVEQLNLHIFEERYKQLVTECHAQKKSFGIPAVINNDLQEYGSLVDITKISKIYDNGEMDITVTAKKMFRILEVIKEVPDKLYYGAIVNYPHNSSAGSASLMKKLIQQMRNLHDSLQVKKSFSKPDEALNSYDIAHHSGLTIEEEYHLLQFINERQRQEFLRQHFEKMMPAMEELQQLKERIQMNGHFRNIKGLDLK